MKKFFIKTYGCQMNVYDSARMADVLVPLGYQETEHLASADLVILNTCHIREKAAEKVYSELGRLRLVKNERARQGEKTLIAVAGCVAQAEGEEIIARAPVVDMVFGPQVYHRLPDFLRRAGEGERIAEGDPPLAPPSLVDTEFPPEDKFDTLPAPVPQRVKARGASAFLTVQEGCDKFCSFCVVPYTRGAEYGRPAAAIIAEAESLVRAGVKEITLLGQNVNAYRGKGKRGETLGLADLLHALSAVEGLERLRYTTSHPLDMGEDLIAAHRALPLLMPYLHLPVQSGSDRILKAMNRRHTAADYEAIIERVREARPDMAISGDFIVGFPGETDEDFADTLALIERVRYASAFSFKYSPRPGTPAAEREDQIPEEIKTARLERLQALLDRQAQAFAHGLIGKTLPVLFEKPGRRPGQIVGRSPYLQPVVLDGPASLSGQIVPVLIEAAAAHHLSGRLVPDGRQVEAGAA